MVSRGTFPTGEVGLMHAASPSHSTKSARRAQVLSVLALLTLFLAGLALDPADAQLSGTTGPADKAWTYLADTQQYTDATSPLADDANGDVPLGGAIGDVLYVGHEQPFRRLVLRTGTTGGAGSVAWEYWNGTAWPALDPRDETEGFQEPGPAPVSFSPPPAWRPTQLSGPPASGTYYYIRARILTPYLPAPVLSQAALEAWEDPAAARLFEQGHWSSRGALTTHVLRDVAASGSLALVVGDGGFLARSTDAGDTWRGVDTPTTQTLHGVELLDTNLAWAVGANGTILKSPNGGLTWQAQTSGTTHALYAVDFVSSNDGYAVGDEVVLKTVNGGQSWTTTSLAGQFLRSVSFGSATTGWVGGEQTTGASLYKTTDAGTQWLPDLPTGATGKIRDVHARSATYAWVVGDGFRSRFKGTVWATEVGEQYTGVTLASDEVGWAVAATPAKIQRITQANADPPAFPLYTPQYETQLAAGLHPRAVAATSPTTVLVVGDDGLILRTTNAGAGWWRSSTATTLDLYAVDERASGVAYAVGKTGTVLRSVDGGGNWSLASVPATLLTSPGDLRAVDFVTDTIGFVASELGSVFNTTDGGLTWGGGPLQDEHEQPLTVPALYGVDFVDDQVGYAVGALGKIYKTTDHGQHWSEKGSSTQDTLRDVAFLTPSQGFAVGTQGKVLRTTDAGETWSSLPVGVTDALNGIHFPRRAVGWIVGENGTILATSDEGQSWQRQSAGTTQAWLDVAAQDAATVLASTANGRIYKSTDAGAHWTEVRSGSTPIHGVAIRPGGLAVGEGGLTLQTRSRWVDARQPAGDLTRADVRLAASLTSEDALYLGRATRFDAVALLIDTPGAGGETVWEAWTGAAWSPVTPPGAAGLFAQAGLRTLAYPLPASWQTLALGSDMEPLYYLRIRFLVAPATPPILTHAGLLSLSTPLSPTESATSSRSPTPTSSTSPTSPPFERTVFGMAANPLKLTLGDVRRGAVVTQNVSVRALNASASVTVQPAGPDATWITLATESFALLPGGTKNIGVTLHVPPDAPPGPHAARVEFTAQPTLLAAAPFHGWVPVEWTVAEADLVRVTFDAERPTWAAEFRNYLARAVAVRLDATLQARGADPEALASQDVTVETHRNATVRREIDPAGRPLAPYDLAVTALFEGQARVVHLTVFLGGPPTTIEGLTTKVRVDEAEFHFRVRNHVDVPLVARPRIELADASGEWVATILGDPVTVEPGAAAPINITWQADFGVFTATARAAVENGQQSPPVQSQFEVVQPHPETSTRPPWLFIAGVGLIVNLLVGLGLWTGGGRGGARAPRT